MQAVELKPQLNITYLIKEVLCARDPEKPFSWWVCWYESRSHHSAGMNCFKTFDEAAVWSDQNPPRETPDGKFDRSTIIYSGR